MYGLASVSDDQKVMFFTDDETWVERRVHDRHILDLDRKELENDVQGDTVNSKSPAVKTSYISTAIAAIGSARFNVFLTSLRPSLKSVGISDTLSTYERKKGFTKPNSEKSKSRKSVGGELLEQGELIEELR